MTLIHTILDTEKTAEELIKVAQDDAGRIVSDAQNATQEQRKNLQKELSEKRAKLIAEAKPELVTIYKKILEVGTAKANEIAYTADRNKKVAIAKILEDIL